MARKLLTICQTDASKPTDQQTQLHTVAACGGKLVSVTALGGGKSVQRKI